MGLYHIFDFNSSLECDVFRSTVAPGPNCDHLIRNLERASVAGGLSTVQHIFDELYSTPHGRYWRKGPGCSLFFAVQNRHKEVVAYILPQGSSLDINHVQAAILNKDKDLLQLFLQYGWDINKAMERAIPPPLA